MNELVKALKDFIGRDIVYITGGVSVILSFLYSFDKINDVFGEDPSIYTVIYIAAIGYVIGWFIQDISALITGQCMTTSLNYQPSTRIQKYYRKFIAVDKTCELKDILDKKIDEIDASIKINKDESRNIAEVERIVSHVLIGTSIGPCWCISSVVLFIKAITEWDFALVGFSVTVFFVSLGLIIIGRVKLVRLKEFTIKMCEDIDRKGQQAKDKQSNTPQDENVHSTTSDPPKKGI